MVGGHTWQGVCMAGGHVWQGGVHGGGVCMLGGVCGREACVVGDMHGRGLCMPHTLPLALRDMVSQCVGSTHPTGMHSCCFIFFEYNH